MTSERLGRLRAWTEQAAGKDVAFVYSDGILRLLDEREALLAAARAIYPEDALVRTGAWELRALADAIANAESP